MNSISWMTFVMTALLGLNLMSRGSFDQPARNLSSEVDLRTQAVAESTSVVRVDEIRDLKNISNALKLKR